MGKVNSSLMIILLSLLTTVSGRSFSLLGQEIPYPQNLTADSVYRGKYVSFFGFDSLLGGIDYRLWLSPEDYLSFAGFSATISGIIHLNAGGGVDSVSADDARWNRYIEGVRNSLHRLQFTPAHYEGDPRDFRLPFEISFSQRRGAVYAVLRLPYWPLGDYYNRLLIDRAMLLNGFSPPRVVRFPAYFSAAGLALDTADYDFGIYQIALDSAGRLIDIFEHCSSRPDYSKQFAQAILYAEFQPALLYGKSFPSEFYIFARFFPQVGYPTSFWSPEKEVSTNFLYDYYRIENLLYLDSIINPPFPLNFPNERFIWPQSVSLNDSIFVAVKIDTLGAVSAKEYLASPNKEAQKTTDIILEKLRFYPARDINNIKRDFFGVMEIRYENSQIIRLKVKWLPHPNAPEG
jgi:hypothetical protein